MLVFPLDDITHTCRSSVDVYVLGYVCDVELDNDVVEGIADISGFLNKHGHIDDDHKSSVAEFLNIDPDDFTYKIINMRYENSDLHGQADSNLPGQTVYYNLFILSSIYNVDEIMDYHSVIESLITSRGFIRIPNSYLHDDTINDLLSDDTLIVDIRKNDIIITTVEYNVSDHYLVKQLMPRISAGETFQLDMASGPVAKQLMAYFTSIYNVEETSPYEDNAASYSFSPK